MITRLSRDILPTPCGWAPQPPLGDDAWSMQIEEEIRSLRESLEPTLQACGHAVAELDDEQFAGQLRRCLMTLTGGAEAVGFDCAVAKTAAGDFLVTLVWSEEASKLQPKTSVGFTAYGPTETLAFLRAAQKPLKHPEYRDLLFRSTGTRKNAELEKTLNAERGTGQPER